MKTRIFTERERHILRDFLKDTQNRDFPKLKYRLRIYGSLEEDVKLYLAVKSKLKKLPNVKVIEA